MDERVARTMWQLFEPVHAVTYFAPQCRAAADAIGMRGFWMGYFAMRAAPLGAVAPEVVTATFYGFSPAMVARAIPDAWTIASPAAALGARLAGVDAALRAIWGEGPVRSRELAQAADLAQRAVTYADSGGRVLAAANAALPSPDEPHLRLWQATTTLREHRGDGHVAALVALRVSPVQSHLVKVAAEEAEATRLREVRRFDESIWIAEAQRLRARGILDEDDRLTEDGRRLHEDVERMTDAAAMAPWRALGDVPTAALAELLRPLAAAVVASGTVPFPNPIGVPRPPVER